MRRRGEAPCDPADFAGVSSYGGADKQSGFQGSAPGPGELRDAAGDSSQEVRTQYGILPADKAYRAIHQPQDAEELDGARRRLVFEEFFVFSAGLSLMRARRTVQQVGAYENLELEPFCAGLPFSLTGAQRRAMEEIAGDLRRGVPMNRLLQGDVGSGKTMVAAAAAYWAARNGVQTALMAPTEILAQQHYRTLRGLLEPLGVRCVLLTGSLTGGEKQRVRLALAGGQAELAIGTHALLSQTTEFARLGMVITDEQHRFGVAQRAALSEKGRGAHLLVMSATPIPPHPGADPVWRFGRFHPGRAATGAAADRHLLSKRDLPCPAQWLLCGRRFRQDTNAMWSAPVWRRGRRNRKGRPGLGGDATAAGISGFAGRPPSRANEGTGKEAAMAEFARGKTQILVATTVIEVGSGCAQRYGDGGGGCGPLLVSASFTSCGAGWAGDRPKLLHPPVQQPQSGHPGQAEGSVQNRGRLPHCRGGFAAPGTGDFFGHRQHGLPTFRAANLSMDVSLLQQAQAAAALWIDRHGDADTSEAACLRARVESLFRDGSVAWN